MTSGSTYEISTFVECNLRLGEAVIEWKCPDSGRLSVSVADDSSLAELLDGCSDASDLATRLEASDNLDRAEWLADISKLEPLQTEHRLEINGTSCWLQEKLVRLQPGEDQPAVTLSLLSDVTESRSHEERLTYLACFDPLTGHFTRTHLRSALAQSLVDAFRTGKPFCFAFIGLDEMAQINHAFGYDVADDVLCGVGDRIQSVLGQDVTLGRVASSKFAVIVNGESISDALNQLHAVQRDIRENLIVTNSGPVAVTASIGAVILPEQARTTQDAFAAAEDSLTSAKAQGPGGFASHKPNLQEIATRKNNLAVAEQLALALREDRLCLAFQPIVSASAPHSCAFYECLARLVDRRGQLVPAATFMPVAEKLGFVRLIDRRVLTLAMRALASNEHLRLSINVSPQSLYDASWHEKFQRLTNQYPDAAHRLIVEITESAAIQEPESAAERIASISGRGCAIALDDFGAGYTSFRHFKTMRFDIVKIDGGFVRNITRSQDDQVFVRALAQLARHFEMLVVAEMVEDQASADLLATLGADCLQGYHFGKPELMPDTTLPELRCIAV